MPKKANPETQKEQSARFRKDARKLIADGELDPEKAASVMNLLICKASRPNDAGRKREICDRGSE